MRIVYVHPLSTIVSAYVQAHPKISLADALARVRSHFELPQTIDVGNALRRRNDHISQEGLLFDPANKEGFVPFVSDQVRLIHEGKSPGRKLTAIHPDSAADEGSSSLLAWAGQQLAGGVLSAGGGDLFAFVLSDFGRAGSDPFTEVQAKLDQLSQQISSLQSSINDLSNELKCSISNLGYGTQAGGFSIDQFNKIDTYAQTVNAMLATDPTNTQAIACYKDDIRDLIRDNKTLHQDLHNFATGSSALGTTGAIQGFGQMLRSCGWFHNAAKSKAIQNQFDYIALNQIGACHAVVNYYTDRGETNLAAAVATDCQNFFKDIQALKVTNSIPAGSTDVVDTRTNLFWTTRGFVNEQLNCSSETCFWRADVGPELAPIPDGRFFVPSGDDLGDFFKDCFKDTDEAAKACLANAGYGAPGGDSFFGAGDFYVWARGALEASGAARAIAPSAPSTATPAIHSATAPRGRCSRGERLGSGIRGDVGGAEQTRLGRQCVSVLERAKGFEPATEWTLRDTAGLRRSLPLAFASQSIARRSATTSSSRRSVPSRSTRRRIGSLSRHSS